MASKNRTQLYLIRILFLLAIIILDDSQCSYYVKVGMNSRGGSIVYQDVFNNFRNYLENKHKQKNRLDKREELIIRNLMAEILRGREIIASERPDIWYLRQG